MKFLYTVSNLLFYNLYILWVIKMKETIKKYYIYGILLIGIVGIFFALFYEPSNQNEILYDSSAERTLYLVDVTFDGAVYRKDTFQVLSNTTIKEALDIAGLKSNADISTIKLDDVIESNLRIYVPSINDLTESIATELLNINTASYSELVELPGIGDSRANAIINYIKENGRIESYDELHEIIKGISNANFEEIKTKSVIE